MRNEKKVLSFEERAEHLLDLLDPDKTRRDRTKAKRPYIIEVTGSPDSGKTTTLDILDAFFRRAGFRVWKPLEGAEAVRDISRSSHLYNIATGTYALSILLSQAESPKYDIVLFDRCLYDAYCWMLYWLKKGKLSKLEAKKIQDFFSHLPILEMIDVAFFVICDPEEAMRRDRTVSLTKRIGSYTNLESIKNLYNIFVRGYQHFKETNRPVILIDTTNLDRQQAAEKILIHTLEAFEQRFKTKGGQE